MLQKTLYKALFSLLRVMDRCGLFIEKKVIPLKVALKARAHESQIQIGTGARFARGSKWHFGRNSTVNIGENVTIHSGCTIAVFDNSELHIDDNSYIGNGCDVMARKSVRIGKETLVAQDCKLIDCNHKWSAENGVERKKFIAKPIDVGNKVWIGTNVVITAGVVIEDNCLIGAGQVIRQNVAKGSRVIP